MDKKTRNIIIVVIIAIAIICIVIAWMWLYPSSMGGYQNNMTPTNGMTYKY